MMNFKTSCPCCSGAEYEKCCKPFHTGVLPINALQLMRSRYCAYALGLSDYIMATTHPENPLYMKNISSWKQSIYEFSKNTVFRKLEILDFKEEGDFATVTFTAHLFQGIQDASFTEKSSFEKVNQRWLYRSGQQEAYFSRCGMTTSL